MLGVQLLRALLVWRQITQARTQTLLIRFDKHAPLGHHRLRPMFAFIAGRRVYLQIDGRIVPTMLHRSVL